MKCADHVHGRFLHISCAGSQYCFLPASLTEFVHIPQSGLREDNRDVLDVRGCGGCIEMTKSVSFYTISVLNCDIVRGEGRQDN